MKCDQDLPGTTSAMHFPENNCHLIHHSSTINQNQAFNSPVAEKKIQLKKTWEKKNENKNKNATNIFGN